MKSAKQEIHDLAVSSLIKDVRAMTDKLKANRNRVYSEHNRSLKESLRILQMAINTVDISLPLNPDCGLPKDDPNYVSYELR